MAEAHAGCGNMLAALRRYDEAIKAYDKALAVAPGLEFVESERLHCKMRLCDWRNFNIYLQRLTGHGKTGKLDAHPFEFLSMSTSAQEQLECAKTWISRKYRGFDHASWRGEIYNHDRIRVAYVSSDFREHAISYLAAGMFECHDKSRFEVTAIAIGADDASDMRQRLKGSFEHFIDAGTLSDDEIASRITKAQIDILVDLNGFTARMPNRNFCATSVTDSGELSRLSRDDGSGLYRLSHCGWRGGAPVASGFLRRKACLYARLLSS